MIKIKVDKFIDSTDMSQYYVCVILHLLTTSGRTSVELKCFEDQFQEHLNYLSESTLFNMVLVLGCFLLIFFRISYGQLGELVVVGWVTKPGP